MAMELIMFYIIRLQDQVASNIFINQFGMLFILSRINFKNLLKFLSNHSTLNNLSYLNVLPIANSSITA